MRPATWHTPKLWRPPTVLGTWVGEKCETELSHATQAAETQADQRWP